MKIVVDGNNISLEEFLEKSKGSEEVFKCLLSKKLNEETFLMAAANISAFNCNIYQAMYAAISGNVTYYENFKLSLKRSIKAIILNCDEIMKETLEKKEVH